MANNTDELRIFVERLRHFLNLWTVYNDMLAKVYVPSIGADAHDEPTYGSYFNPSVTIMLVLYAYFYSLIEDSEDGLNGFRVWREHFPEEEPAISAVEAQIKPFTNDLRIYRNRLGFHGSRTRKHEASGFDLFANTSGSAMWKAIENFKALAAMLIAKDTMVKNGSSEEATNLRDWIDAVAARARQQMSSD